MTRHAFMTKAQRAVAWVGVALGIIAIIVSIRVAQDSNTRTQAALTAFQSSSCSRQHESGKQWESVVAVITDLQEHSRPGSSQSPQFQDFVKRTEAIYNKFPACHPKT